MHQRERALNLLYSTECEYGINAKVSIERASYVPGQFLNSIAPCPLSTVHSPYFSHIFIVSKSGWANSRTDTYVHQPWYFPMVKVSTCWNFSPGTSFATLRQTKCSLFRVWILKIFWYFINRKIICEKNYLYKRFCIKFYCIIYIILHYISLNKRIKIICFFHYGFVKKCPEALYKC